MAKAHRLDSQVWSVCVSKVLEEEEEENPKSALEKTSSAFAKKLWAASLKQKRENCPLRQAIRKAFNSIRWHWSIGRLPSTLESLLE